MIKGYTSWVLDEPSRAALLELVKPMFGNVIAHHVTEDYGVPADHPIEAHPTILVLGETMNKGVQAVAVSVNGRLRRADGRPYHITLSLDDGRFSHESNDVIERGWWPFEQPLPITTTADWHEIKESK